MTVPSYTTDLVDINLGVITWKEPTGATAGGLPVAETDYFIEGTQCISKSYNAVGLGGMFKDYGSDISIPSGKATFHWVYWGCPNTLASLYDGGYRIMIGNTAVSDVCADYYMWYVLGSDTYLYGGWVNVAVDPTNTDRVSYGSPSGATRCFGSIVFNANAVSKGNPYGNDAIRYGRELIVEFGQVADYATFEGAATQNDVITNRWGLFQAITGGYLQKGLFLMGTATSIVDFRDTNRNILIQDCPKTSTNFNTFEVRNAGSHIDWTGIQISALGTISKGRFITTDNATITLDNCTFTDMNTFGFLANSTILATTFRRCGIITQGGAVFTNCKFDSASGTKALVVDTVANVTATQFISSGTGYALEGFGVAGDYTFTNLTFSGYALQGGTATNRAIHVLATSGTVAISIIGGDTPSYDSAGATVTFPSSVTLTMTVKGTVGGVENQPIENAQAFIDQDPPVEPWIMNELTNASGIATESWTGGAVSNAIWRVRKYGYIPFQQIVSISTANISLPVTMVIDPLQI